MFQWSNAKLMENICNSRSFNRQCRIRCFLLYHHVLATICQMWMFHDFLPNKRTFAPHFHPLPLNPNLLRGTWFHKLFPKNLRHVRQSGNIIQSWLERTCRHGKFIHQKGSCILLEVTWGYSLKCFNERDRGSVRHLHLAKKHIWLYILKFITLRKHDMWKMRPHIRSHIKEHWESYQIIEKHTKTHQNGMMSYKFMIVDLQVFINIPGNHCRSKIQTLSECYKPHLQKFGLCGKISHWTFGKVREYHLEARTIA